VRKIPPTIVHLRELQAFLYRRVTASPRTTAARRGENDSACSEVELESVIRSAAGPAALERIEIYSAAYFQRLLECLKENFPATVAVVGEIEFGELVREYLVAYPPTEPSIDWAGRRFASFLASQSRIFQPPFLADLAGLEWTISDVFVAPDGEALNAVDLRKIAPEDWPRLSLRMIPASAILECGWRVAGVRRAIENSGKWTEPAREPTAVIIWRRAGQVYFRELDAAENAALKIVSSGATFETLCETLAERLDDKNPVEAINRIFARWIEDGLLAMAPAVDAVATDTQSKDPSGAKRRFCSQR
jgi:hypothetical protein